MLEKWKKIFCAQAWIRIRLVPKFNPVVFRRMPIIPFKSINNFLKHPARRETDRQTDRQTGVSHYLCNFVGRGNHPASSIFIVLDVVTHADFLG